MPVASGELRYRSAVRLSCFIGVEDNILLSWLSNHYQWRVGRRLRRVGHLSARNYQSVQEYLRGESERIAARPPVNVWLRHVRRPTAAAGTVVAASVLEGALAAPDGLFKISNLLRRFELFRSVSRLEATAARRDRLRLKLDVYPAMPLDVLYLGRFQQTGRHRHLAG